MDPQSQTASTPGAGAIPIPQSEGAANQAPDLAALAQGIPSQATPQAPGVQPTPEQIDPRLAIAAQILQQEQSRRAELEQQVEAAEAQRVNEWYNGLDEQNKPFGQWAIGAIKQVKEAQKTIAQLQAENAQLKNTFMPYVRNDTLSQLSQQHGVPRQFLEQYAESPEIATAVARAAAALLKEQQFKARQEAQLDQAATPSMTASGTPSRDAITEQFRGGQNGGLEAKLRAFAAAGLR